MNSKSLHPARVGAAILFFVSSAAAFAAAATPTPETPDKPSLLNADQCKNSLNSGDASIYQDSGTTLKSAFDPRHNCESNAGDEITSNNASAVEQTPLLIQYRNSFGSSRSLYELKRVGACRAAYAGIKEVFDTVRSSQAEFCDKLNSAWSEASKCGAVTKDCQKQWETYRDANRAFSQGTIDKVKLAINYLSGLSQAATKAKELYESDLSRLDPIFAKRTPGAKTNGASGDEALPDIAANGNKNTQNSRSVEEYYNLLRSKDALTAVRGRDAINRQSGILIQEEDAAIKNIDIFNKAFQVKLSVPQKAASEAAGSIDTMLARMEQNGSVPEKETPTSKFSRYTGNAAAVAPFATMFNKGDTAGLSQMAGAAHDAHVAEVAAAGLGGAIAAHNIDSSGGSRAPAQIAAPEGPAIAAAAPSKPEVGSLGDHPLDSGKPEKAVTPIGVGAGTHADGVIKAEGEPAVAGGTGAVIGGGSSRNLGGHHAGAGGATPAGAAVEQGGAGTNEAMTGNFTNNLEPKPAPKAATTSPGAEVANLLGQMKNLFNFDEGAPGMGGAPGASNPGVPAAQDSGAGYNGGAQAATEAPAEDGAAPAAEAAAAAETSSGTKNEEAHGSPFGKVDTSLFARVRARHHRCMERGLVLYGLRERVE